MKSFTNRGLKALNLKQYNKLNQPLNVGYIDLTPPTERQYVLRCLIKTTFEDLQIPDFLEWTRPLVEKAFEAQALLGIRQPFCYITVRNGIVETKTDDAWHVDGFSLKVTHLPEQNYIWASHTPTEYITKKFNFPADFNPMEHNIHTFFHDNITPDDKIKTMKAKTIYGCDPYVVHRRPSTTRGSFRTFVRVSFTPIEINDLNNTLNPLIETNYKRDGIKDFRNNLIKYEKNIL